MCKVDQAVSLYTANADDTAPLKLAVFDRRDERLALKSSLAGRVLERAGIPEVQALVSAPADGARAA